MDEMFVRISMIQKKMEQNRNLQMMMKVVGGLIVLVIFFCSLSQPDTMKLAWMISVPCIILVFFLDAYFLKSNKASEFEIYKLEIEELENKKEMAGITGEALPDAVLNRDIKVPTKEVSYPILYYIIILILDILIKVLMIH
ncbi:MAG: hypothetical protein NC309_04625 [Ruminococcus sp.]|nr:hypothetical protein [Clostridium sp.]MCM1208188.1 hypothetical protein [Ruminococcus sp.]